MRASSRARSALGEGLDAELTGHFTQRERERQSVCERERGGRERREGGGARTRQVAHR